MASRRFFELLAEFRSWACAGAGAHLTLRHRRNHVLVRVHRWHSRWCCTIECEGRDEQRWTRKRAKAEKKNGDEEKEFDGWMGRQCLQQRSLGRKRGPLVDAAEPLTLSLHGKVKQACQALLTSSSSRASGDVIHRLPSSPLPPFSCSTFSHSFVSHEAMLRKPLLCRFILTPHGPVSRTQSLIPSSHSLLQALFWLVEELQVDHQSFGHLFRAPLGQTVLLTRTPLTRLALGLWPPRCSAAAP